MTKHQFKISLKFIAILSKSFQTCREGILNIFSHPLSRIFASFYGKRKRVAEREVRWGCHRRAYIHKYTLQHAESEKFVGWHEFLWKKKFKVQNLKKYFFTLKIPKKCFHTTRMSIETIINISIQNPTTQQKPHECEKYPPRFPH